MIIGFDTDKKYSDKEIHIKFDMSYSGKFKIPDYHLTSEQILKFPNTSAIIIPDNINHLHPRNNYNPIELIQHIRLISDHKYGKIQIFIDLQALEDSDLEKIIELKVLDITDLYGRNDPITDERLEAIIGSILDEKIDLTESVSSRHDRSNQWGSYRLLHQLDSLNSGLSYKVELTELKNKLSQKYYFKKLIWNEASRTSSNAINFSEKESLKTKLISLQNQSINIGIIEDEGHIGWESAYKALFGEKNNIEFIYPILPNLVDYDNFEKRKENFELFLNNLKSNSYNIEKFDLVILDMRLYEKSHHISSEIIDVEDLSGIQILNEIKHKNPEVPVIICTASNKSWTHDFAVHCGAEGFWTKESPDYGLSAEYQFYNAFSLVSIIEKVLLWSKDIRPLYASLLEMNRHIENENIPVAKSLLKKANMVFSQLHISKSKFIEKNLGQSGLSIAYLTVSSIINEVISLKREVVNNDYFVNVDGKKYKFCKYIDSAADQQNLDANTPFGLSKKSSRIQPHKKFGDGINYFIIEDDVLSILEDKKYPPKKYVQYFPEKDFVKFMLYKSGLSSIIGEYFKLRSKRNQLDIIHSKPISDLNDSIIQQLNYKDLFNMLDIFHRLITGKRITINK